jgi:superfamily II DNA or RNA helicase/HKD family nuclease
MPILPTGAYDLLVTKELAKEIEELIRRGIPVSQEVLDPVDAAEPMSRAIAALISRRLGTLGASENATIAQVAADANRTLQTIGADSDDSGSFTGHRLTAIGSIGLPTPRAPIVPLSEHYLITGERGEKSLGAQLQREVESADEIDLLCSFIKRSGTSILIDSLQRFCDRPNNRLRVLTTTYTGATDPDAVNQLALLRNCEVRVSYDTDSTRLHAKSWIFRRRSNFGTAFVGSANISHPALTEGLEWTIRISQSRERQLWDKLNASFETSWNDPAFRRYDPADQDHVRTLREAIARAGAPRGSRTDDLLPVYDLQPKDFQSEILERLDRERRILKRARQLVVAATGTGKTMIAAFDYRRYRADPANEVAGRPPRLLYLAHREEILKQALRSFRGVLRRQDFGCVLSGTSAGDTDQNVFATIQSFRSRDLLSRLGPSHWDYVVLDEAHHSDASTYRDILQRITPKILLGLTATPERADGADITQYFDHAVSAEVRLPDAIERRLLVPFQYFVARDDDSVQLSTLEFRRGRYDAAALETMLDGNRARATLIVQELQRRVLDPRRMRGIGFCAGVRHARYMAKVFSENFGIPALALTGDDSPDRRQEGIGKLRDRQVNVIFAADLFNEGIDIPEIDTVMFLRPTESLTVFLQQLGRGLRRSDYKEVLTVLDFVANVDKRYRLDRKFRSLLAKQSVDLARECKDGFPTLPAGCAISMDRDAQDRVLDSIRQYGRPNRRAVIDEIRHFIADNRRAPSLREYLATFDRDLIDVYGRGTWSSLSAEAMQIPSSAASSKEIEKHARSAMKRLCMVDDRSWMENIEQVVKAARGGRWRPSDAIGHLHAGMLGRTLWTDQDAPRSTDELVSRLNANAVLTDEIDSLLEVARDRISADSETIDVGFDHALKLHAQYTSDQILTALGMLSGNQQSNLREGIKFDKERKIYLMFVTLCKPESEFSESTRFDDYAISPTHFHWQTQNSAGPNLESGRRVIDHRSLGIKLLLFVRERRKDRDVTLPFMFLGEFKYESHQDAKPMSVVGQLSHAIPAAVLRYAMKAG